MHMNGIEIIRSLDIYKKNKNKNKKKTKVSFRSKSIHLTLNNNDWGTTNDHGYTNNWGAKKPHLQLKKQCEKDHYIPQVWRKESQLSIVNWRITKQQLLEKQQNLGIYCLCSSHVNPQIKLKGWRTGTRWLPGPPCCWSLCSFLCC